jgi:hypothetical protein
MLAPSQRQGCSSKTLIDMRVATSGLRSIPPTVRKTLPNETVTAPPDEGPEGVRWPIPSETSGSRADACLSRALRSSSRSSASARLPGRHREIERRECGCAAKGSPVAGPPGIHAATARERECCKCFRRPMYIAHDGRVKGSSVVLDVGRGCRGYRRRELGCLLVHPADVRSAGQHCSGT